MQDFFGRLDATQELWVYTDGSCLGNPGRGGWGVHLRQGAAFFEVCGDSGETATTNNRMELVAAIEALGAVATHGYGGPVVVFSDSRYVIDGIEKWLAGWKRNGWKTASKSPVKNEDLWRALDEGTRRVAGPLVWRWVRGHAGNAGNDAADRLARTGKSGTAPVQSVKCEE